MCALLWLTITTVADNNLLARNVTGIDTGGKKGFLLVPRIGSHLSYSGSHGCSQLLFLILLTSY
jgi:hypothetical protein